MRAGLLLGLSAVIAVFAGPVRAEDPVPAVTAPPMLPPAPPPVMAGPPGVIVAEPTFIDESHTSIALDLILGMQTGARLQGVVHQAGNRMYVAEGFYGAMFSKLGSSEAAGVGGRAIFRRLGRDNCHAMLLGPGVNMFYQFHDDSQWIIAPSVDLAWLRSIGDFGAGWQVGINAGVGVSVSGRESGEDVVTPIISIFTGFRF